MNNFFLEYFIIDRKNGISYNPEFIIKDKVIIANSNKATDTKPFVINIPKLIIGLKEKRYRLTPKNNYTFRNLLMNSTYTNINNL